MEEKLTPDNGLGFAISGISLMRYALPTILSSIFMNVYSLVDSLFVADLVSIEALSAVNIVGPALAIALAVGTMIATGGCALVSKQMGQGDEKGARENFSFFVAFAFGVSLAFCLLGLALRRPLLGMMGADDALYPLCEAYAIPVFLIIPLLILPRIWGVDGVWLSLPTAELLPLGRPSTTSRQRRGYTTMAELELKGQDARFCEIMQRIGHLYEEYAKSKGMTYMSMCILEAICTHPDNCTQKCICEETHYPKQSVNLIIKSFLQAGYITLEELSADRRNKHIMLTEKGRDYAAAYEDGVKRAAGMP